MGAPGVVRDDPGERRRDPAAPRQRDPRPLLPGAERHPGAARHVRVHDPRGAAAAAKRRLEGGEEPPGQRAIATRPPALARQPVPIEPQLPAPASPAGGNVPDPTPGEARRTASAVPPDVAGRRSPARGQAMTHARARLTAPATRRSWSRPRTVSPAAPTWRTPARGTSHPSSD